MPIITVSRVPGTPTHVDLPEGATISDALREAGIPVGPADKVYAGTALASNLNAPVEEGKAIAVSTEAKGNAGHVSSVEELNAQVAKPSKAVSAKVKNAMENNEVTIKTLLNGQDVAALPTDVLVAALTDNAAQREAIKKLPGTVERVKQDRLAKLDASDAAISAILDARLDAEGVPALAETPAAE